jgi:hypothetical protein
MPGDDIEPIIILDSNDRGYLSNITDPVDKPLLNTFAAGSFGDLNQDGVPDFVTGGVGLRLATNLAGGYANEPFQHQVGVWDTATGDMLPGFPQQIEDYLFFVNPSVADVSNDGYPEVITGSGGYYVHAWDACGFEAPGFPKFTGQWITASVALGDLTGDGNLEAVITTRGGYMYAWRTEGRADGAMSWPEYRHDSHNTGNYDSPLPHGGMNQVADEPIECPDPPPMPDGGVDGGTGGEPGGGGCNCRVAPSRQGSTGALWFGLPALLALFRPRRR